MIEKEVDITNKVGLHARPASLLVEAAHKFRARIWIEKDGQVADGKNIMSLLLLAADKGSSIKIRAEGSDAAEAVQTLVQLVKNKFGEE
ncbi:HPr family phosphocarrier protein [Candidatus Aerophobetes bacterium]|uniref:HPr family phosphocarrier protein n=1 Tax=Aerophobetes bacterium TaxID=2030807 RepID=A0A523UVM6_UNCAE|nr:MAG: HPr family phosphocarrier protein [Candidatus Aerophobetes bacterium]